MAQTRTFKAGVLASGQALTSLVGLISSAWLSRILSLHDYATYRQTTLVFMVAMPLLSLGLPNALYYFLPGEAKRARAILSENLLLLLVLGAAFTALLLAGGNRWLARSLGNPELTRTLLIMAPTVLLSLPSASLPPCLMAVGRASPISIYNVVTRVALLLCVMVPSLIWRTPVSAVAGHVVASGLFLAPALWLMARATDSPERTPTWQGMRTQFAFAVPLGAATIFGLLAQELHKVIVSRLCGPEVFAVYVNGAMEFPIVTVITVSAASVLLPEMSLLYKQGRTGDMLEIWKRTAVRCAVFLVPAMALLLALAAPLIRVLYSPKYTESALPFILYLLMLPARVAIFSAVFLAAGQNAYMCFRSFMAMLASVALSLIGVQQMGYLGAAVGSVLALYLCEMPLNLIGIQRIVRQPQRQLLPYRELARIFAAAFACALPVTALATLGRLPDLPLLVLGSLLYAAVVIPVLQRMGHLDLRAQWAMVRNGVAGGRRE